MGVLVHEAKGGKKTNNSGKINIQTNPSLR